MTSQGPNSPSTVVNDASMGAEFWSNPSAAASSDDSYAVASNLEMFIASVYLKATGFGFAVPGDSEVAGVRVEIERHGSGDPARAVDWELRLVKAGTVRTGDRHSTDDWPVTDAYVACGGESDLWGETLTPSDVNAPGFGVALRAKGDDGAIGGSFTATAYVDHIRMTVFYYRPVSVSDGGAGADPAEAGPAVSDGGAGADPAEAGPALPDGGTGGDAAGLDKEFRPSDSGAGGDAGTLTRHLSAGMARERTHLRPVCLVEIATGNSGPTLFFSDVPVEVSGRRYEDYLLDLSGVGEELRRATSSGLNAEVTLRFKNDRYGAYDCLVEMGETYPFEGAGCVIKAVYLDGGGTPSVEETVFKGVLDEPRDIGLLGFACRASSMVFARDRQWTQKRVNLADFPEASEDAGKTIPFVYGADVRMPALRTAWGARSTLVSAIDASQTAGIVLSDPSRFPAAGTVIVDEEEISYSSITAGGELEGAARGGGGTATAHHSGAVAWEKRTAYESVLADHELSGVGDVFAEFDGHLVRVASGVEALVSEGRHILRAFGQIRLRPTEDQTDVLDTIGVSEGSHSHGVASTEVRVPTGSSHWGTDYGGNTTWTGTDGNVRDQSDVTSLGVSTGGPYDQFENIQATFPAYSGPSPTAVYGCITHDTVGIGGTFSASLDYVEMDSSGMKVTQKLYLGTTVPTTLIARLNVDPGGSASMKVYEMWLEVHVSQTSSSPATGVAKTGAASKTGEVVVSTRAVDRFHAVVSGAKDPDGNYGGLGALMERPDLVMKHFLVNRMGFALEDIDASSFEEAGASFDGAVPGGYRFAFAVERDIRPSEFLQRMAREARSTVSFERGKWRLEFVPDGAPAPVRTIAREELAGEHAEFRFEKTPVVDMANDLAARFGRDYSRLGSESEWLGTSAASDAASKAKYGTYPGEFEFECIRLQDVADSVLAHMLRERKAPLLTATFTVFYEHFDLTVGDTIQIDNPLFGGRTFSIESVRRTDKFRAEVRAVEWWA